MDKIFFQSWDNVLRTVIMSILAYAALVVLLRVSGKRTLSKMNAFDLVVTVALGSLLASCILSKDVALADGLIGFAMLIFLQLLVTWLSVRWRWFSRMIKSDPVLLVYNGQYHHDNMRKERVTKEEVLAALREKGVSSLEQVKAVVLETDSNLTVIAANGAPATVLENVISIKD